MIFLVGVMSFFMDETPFGMVFCDGFLMYVVLLFLDSSSYLVRISLGGFLGLNFQFLASRGDNHLYDDFMSCDTCTTYLTRPSLNLLWGKWVRV